MQLAVSAAVGEREAGAWTRVQLGLLYLSTGRPKLAAIEMRQALQLFPGYAFGLDGMAQTQVALGHVTAALRYEQEAVNRIPLPQYVGLLGDLYHAGGNEAAAQQQYSLIGDIERLLAANGVRNDLDIALFDVDHGIRLQHALELARQGFAFRPSVFGDDVLGVGARAQRLLRRGAALLPPVTAARHPRRRQVLPPRHDRAVPRPERRGAHVVQAGARAQPPLLRPLGTGREEARMKRLLLVALVCARLRAGRRRPIRWATSRSTISPASRCPAIGSMCATSSTWRRSRRCRRCR